MERICMNCQQEPATEKVLGYDVCQSCADKAYVNPSRR